MKTTYNFGIIGAGWIAEQQVRALNMIPQANIIGIATRHLETSSAFKDKMCSEGCECLKSCKCFTDYHELLQMKDLDFVSISVPNKIHKEVLFDVAQAGKHLICEKPVANNLKDADEMIEVMDKKNLKFAVYHEGAFYEENLLIKELIKQDIFKAAKFAWDGALAIGRWNWNEDAWRVDPAISGGGAIMDEGVHLCHLLKIYFDHQKPLFVNAFIDRLGQRWTPCEDTGTMMFEFSSGTAVASTSFQPHIGRTRNMTTYSQGIIAENGSIEIIFKEKAEGVFSPVKKVLVTTPEEVKEYPMPDYSWPLEKNANAFKKLFLDFIDSVENDKTPYVNGRSARDAMEMVMASYLSVALGKTIRLPLDKESPIYTEGVLGLKKLDSQIAPDSILRRKKMYGF